MADQIDPVQWLVTLRDTIPQYRRIKTRGLTPEKQQRTRERINKRRRRSAIAVQIIKSLME